MSTPRNPITNPVPGDVTRTPDGSVRVVYARTPDEERPGLVQWRVIHRDGETGDGSMPVNGWRIYNVNAEVLCAMDGARPRDSDLLVAAEALVASSSGMHRGICNANHVGPLGGGGCSCPMGREFRTLRTAIARARGAA